MVAGMLASLGMWAGITKPGDRYNPKGYFENTALKWLLKRNYGFALLGDFPQIKSGWKEIVRYEITEQGYQSGPWLFKTGVHYSDVWSEFNPIVVKVMRNREKILESYARYGGIWSSYGAEGATKIIDRGLERLRDLSGIEIDADRLALGDQSGIEKVCRKAFWPFHKIDFIVPGAFHAG